MRNVEEAMDDQLGSWPKQLGDCWCHLLNCQPMVETTVILSMSRRQADTVSISEVQVRVGADGVELKDIS